MIVRQVVVVGAGQGGFQVAASLRQEGFDGEILLLGDEQELPYQRPPLSKTYLKDGNADRLLFRAADFYEKNIVSIETGVRVTDIDRRERTVRLDDGRSFSYDHLVLALGARNRRLPLAGIEAAGVHGLRTLADANCIGEALAGASRLVVIGGGFIGLEMAATAAGLGKAVTVLEATHRLLSRVVSPAISDFFLAAHQGFGVDVRLNAFAKRILQDGEGRAAGVEMEDGSRIEADLVLVSAGVVPNVELAAEAGLYVHDGIRVNDRLETEDPCISAIGDCASFPFGHDGVKTRLESVQNAVDQAKCVARRLVGHPESYRKIPWFWSDQGPHKLQMAGLTAGADHHIVRRSEDGAKLSVFCFRRGELVGVETVNAAADHMGARKLLAGDAPIGLERFEAGGGNLSALLAR